MSVKIQIIRRGEQLTGTWSGGATTQLAIYPNTSAYHQRNFLWRLSSAHVDIEESTFTSLPGIWRHIMLIEGEMRLIHEGHHSVLLKAYEQDSFSGSWTTKGIGCGRDFNLMLGQGSKGCLEALHINRGCHSKLAVSFPEKGFKFSADAFYCVSGSTEAVINEESKHILNEGDIMIAYSDEGRSSINIRLSCVKDNQVTVIRSVISHN